MKSDSLDAGVRKVFATEKCLDTNIQKYGNRIRRGWRHDADDSLKNFITYNMLEFDEQNTEN